MAKITHGEEEPEQAHIAGRHGYGLFRTHHSASKYAVRRTVRTRFKTVHYPINSKTRPVLRSISAAAKKYHGLPAAQKDDIRRAGVSFSQPPLYQKREKKRVAGYHYFIFSETVKNPKSQQEAKRT